MIFKKLLLTFFAAMLPVFELRGAIPLGIAQGLPPAAAFCAAVLGNLIPVPFIVLLSRRIIDFGKRLRIVARFFTWFEQHASKKSELVLRYKTIGLILLVAIPLPGTGAWTGAVAAALLDLRLKTTLPAVTVGVLIAGGLVTALSCGIFSVPL